MIDGYDSSVQKFLLDLNANNRRLQKAQGQISSGLRVSAASDDPSVVVDILETRARSTIAAQAKQNLSQVQTEVNAADDAMSTAITVVQQAIHVAAQGATALSTATERTQLANHLEGLLSQLVQISGTRVEGRYIFSGDNDQQPPYTIDLSQTTPVSAYAGSASTRQVHDATGNPISVARTAQQIFDSSTPGESVFKAMSDLRTALLSNNQTDLSAAQADLISSFDHLNAEQSNYGKYQNQLASAITAASQLEVQSKAELASYQDADLAAAATELSQSLLQQQASLVARARMPQTSLFDYLA